MNGYSGKIIFYKPVSVVCRDIILVQIDKYGTATESFKESIDDVYLGECEVAVDFVDTRSQEIANLEEKITQERANREVKINQYLGRIQELMALEQIE